MPKGFKSTPLTLGALIVLITAFIGIAAFMRKSDADINSKIDHAISTHSKDVTVHENKVSRAELLKYLNVINSSLSEIRTNQSRILEKLK